MVRYLDKGRELALLSELFDLLYENMEHITPFTGSFSDEKIQWLSCIAEAIEKEPRKILLLYRKTELAGFCMYYINGGKLMVEEMQIRSSYQRTSIAAELFRFLRKILPPDTNKVESTTLTDRIRNLAVSSFSQGFFANLFSANNASARLMPPKKRIGYMGAK